MYTRLPFHQYFIDTSNGFGGVPSVDFVYDEIIYTHNNHQHTAHYKVLYLDERNVIQIHFQGTCGLNQWFANFEFSEDYYDEFEYNNHKIQLRVHEGWGCMYKAMKHIIREQYNSLHEAHPDAELEICGWSLGSGQAMLCAQDLFYNFGVRGHIFTFGSVKPFYGKDPYMKEYLHDCYLECWNFSMNNDIVGYLVPLPYYFKFNNITIKEDRFCITKLFNPGKYHMEYYKPELYINL